MSGASPGRLSRLPKSGRWPLTISTHGLYPPVVSIGFLLEEVRLILMLDSHVLLYLVWLAHLQSQLALLCISCWAVFCFRRNGRNEHALRTADRECRSRTFTTGPASLDVLQETHGREQDTSRCMTARDWTLPVYQWHATGPHLGTGTAKRSRLAMFFLSEAATL